MMMPEKDGEGKPLLPEWTAVDGESDAKERSPDNTAPPSPPTNRYSEKQHPSADMSADPPGSVADRIEDIHLEPSHRLVLAAMFQMHPLKLKCPDDFIRATGLTVDELGQSLCYLLEKGLVERTPMHGVFHDYYELTQNGNLAVNYWGIRALVGGE